MKKLIYTGIILCLILIGTGFSQPILQNLLPNGSFEYQDKDTVRTSPDASWTFSTEDENVTGHVTQSKSLDRFRSYLIRAENGSGTLTSDPVNVQRRKLYMLSYGICGDGTLKTEVIWFSDQNDTLTILEDESLSITPAPPDWGIHHFDITAPRRAAAASVQFTVSDGQVWIDDVRFREDVRYR